MRTITDTSDTAKRIALQCAGKVAHKDQDAAMIAVRKMAAKEPTKKFRPYYCPICHLWHVGSVGGEK